MLLGRLGDDALAGRLLLNWRLGEVAWSRGRRRHCSCSFEGRDVEKLL